MIADGSMKLSQAFETLAARTGRKPASVMQMYYKYSRKLRQRNDVDGSSNDTGKLEVCTDYMSSLESLAVLRGASMMTHPPTHTHALSLITRSHYHALTTACHTHVPVPTLSIS